MCFGGRVCSAPRAARPAAPPLQPVTSALPPTPRTPDVIEPAIHGTRSVLEAAAAASPKPARVVVTSSVCAIHDQNQKHVPAAGAGAKYTEADWNSVSTADKEPYWVSKVGHKRTQARALRAHART